MVKNVALIMALEGNNFHKTNSIHFLFYDLLNISSESNFK